MPKISPMPAAPTELLRISRVAHCLDVSTKQVYHMIELGSLAAIRIGPRQLRVQRAALEAYIAECPYASPLGEAAEER